MLGRILVLALLWSGVAFGDDSIPKEIVRLRVESASIGEGPRDVRIVIAAEVADGWHVNSTKPLEEGLIPSALVIEPVTGWQVLRVESPPGVERTFAFAGGRALSVYDGTVRFTAELRAPDTFAAEQVEFLARLRYQACDDERCLRPNDVERRFLVRVGLIPGVAVADPQAAELPADDAAPVERWIRERGLAPTLALIVLLGLGLNLTPCVYPLISVTLAYFSQQSGASRGRVIALSILYAAGIAVTFSALGVAAALSGGLFGAALQQPITLIALATLMIALAASSFGLYTIRPPAWLMQRVGGSTTGAAGAFAMGLTMGIVAAPCVGPIIVGLLAAVAERGDPAFGLLLFFALAVGLGAPYVVLGSLAGSLHRLPRSGDWQVWVEHLFGFALLGLALYFVSPLLAPGAVRLVTAVLLVTAGLFLGFVDGAGRSLAWMRIVRFGVAAAAVGATFWVLVPTDRRPTIAWVEFSEQRLADARAAGRAVVVDFRADWCLPCIEMERTTFIDPEVLSASRDVLMLRADVTEMNAEAEASISRHHVLGVPTTLFFGSGGRELHRRVGYVGADDFARLLGVTRSAGVAELPPAASGRPSGRPPAT